MNLSALRVMYELRRATVSLSAAAIPVLSTADALLSESSQSLRQIRDQVSAWAASPNDAEAQLFREMAYEVNAAFAAIDQRATITHCAEPAHLYLSAGSTLQLDNAGVLEIRVIGDVGNHDFAFASGTTQVDIIDAVNSFAEQTGTKAEQSDENPERIRFLSLSPGSAAWVRVRQLNLDTYNANLLAECPFCIVITSDLMDYGFDGFLGDVDCDHQVDEHDLIAVLDAWGRCPIPPQACPADVNVDGIVNVIDLLEVINHWREGAQQPPESQG